MGMVITYEYGENLYVNTTNRCDMRCEFCIRRMGDGLGEADTLWLDREPTLEEMWTDICKRDLSQYNELVFCGYGEPAYRLEDIFILCDRIRAASSIGLRINTDGHANLIHGRDMTPEFRGRFDVVSVSLNAPDEQTYEERCLPRLAGSFEGMLDFTRSVRQYVPKVIMSVVDCIEQEEIEKCRQVCQQAGAGFRVRVYGT